MRRHSATLVLSGTAAQSRCAPMKPGIYSVSSSIFLSGTVTKPFFIGPVMNCAAVPHKSGGR